MKTKVATKYILWVESLFENQFRQGTVFIHIHTIIREAITIIFYVYFPMHPQFSPVETYNMYAIYVITYSFEIGNFFERFRIDFQNVMKTCKLLVYMQQDVSK